jgi:ATP-binding cassette subfamily B (MDR/TAP) protein 1
MGDGLVLEHGTHNELLAREGPYSHLVSAQKLRETREAEALEGDSESDGEGNDIEAKVREEIPLARRNTGRSLASEIVERRRLAAPRPDEEKDLNLPSLFKTMVSLMPGLGKNYVIGAIFACSAFAIGFSPLMNAALI